MAMLSTIKKDPLTPLPQFTILYNSPPHVNKGGPAVGATAPTTTSEVFDFDSSEITVIFENEEETLYVGPVEICPEKELQAQKEAAEAAAAAAAAVKNNESAPNKVVKKLVIELEATESTSNGSDSGIENENSSPHDEQIVPQNKENIPKNIPISKKRVPKPKPKNTDKKVEKVVVLNSESKAKHTCDVCNLEFTRESTLNGHKQFFHRNEEKKKGKRKSDPPEEPKKDIPLKKDKIIKKEPEIKVQSPVKEPVEPSAPSKHSTSPSIPVKTPGKSPDVDGSAKKFINCDYCFMSYKKPNSYRQHLKQAHRVILAPDAEIQWSNQPRSEDEEPIAITNTTLPLKTESVPKSPINQVKETPVQTSLPPTDSPKRKRGRPRVIRKEEEPKKEEKSSKENENYPIEPVIPEPEPEPEPLEAVQVEDILVLEAENLEETGNKKIFIEIIDQKTNEDNSETVETYESYEVTVLQKPPKKQKGDKKIKRDRSKSPDPPHTPVRAGRSGKFDCEQCWSSFSKKHSLFSHIDRIHKRKKDKICAICLKGFTATGDLTRHIRTHTGVKPFKCDFKDCNFSFATSGDLYKHRRRHTKDTDPIPKPHICEFCDAAFDRSYDLKRHKLRHQMKDPTFVGYECNVCKQKFCRKDEYKAHSFRHLGVKLHKCHICGKPFGDLSNCAKHVKMHGPLMHDMTHPLSCGLCGEHFKSYLAISRHVMMCGISNIFQHHWVPQQEPIKMITILESESDK